MPTAVLEVDLEKLPPEIQQPEKYNRAQILVRFQGKPIVLVSLPLEKGRVDGRSLHEKILSNLNWTFFESWLHHYLGWEEEWNQAPPAATVAVCTHDRPADLQRCLDALMRIPDEGQECLVVDNRPSDDASRRIVESYERVRYIREDRPGLNAARNRALREAGHEIVAFIDDDATPDPGWLRALVRNFRDTSVLCVTGLTLPLEMETEAQEWFEDHCPFHRGLQKMRYDRNNLNPLRASRVGAGVNMAFRRSVLELVGPFDEALDGGTRTRSGGDTEMFCRLLAAGYQIIYEPSALVRHCHRRQWEELRRIVYGYTVGTYAFWTRSLVVGGEWGVVRLGWNWFFQGKLRDFLHSLLRRPGSNPLEFGIKDLLACAAGPLAYFISRRALRLRNGE